MISFISFFLLIISFDLCILSVLLKIETQGDPTDDTLLFIDTVDRPTDNFDFTNVLVNQAQDHRQIQ